MEYEKMTNVELAATVREYIGDEGREVILTETDSRVFAAVADRLESQAKGRCPECRENNVPWCANANCSIGRPNTYPLHDAL